MVAKFDDHHRPGQHSKKENMFLHVSSSIVMHMPKLVITRDRRAFVIKCCVTVESFLNTINETAQKTEICHNVLRASRFHMNRNSKGKEIAK